jgi:4-amino-4-deoxy-L-arabinose transferase-like glycosyltransferase
MQIRSLNEKNRRVFQASIAKRCNKAFAHTWELYPILLIAAFLRLYRVDTVVFVDDNAVVFSMARDAIVHGLWPITSNRASLGMLNFPLVVYLFMLPASISPNPLWAEAMVGLLNTIAVGLAYAFVYRYYGRLTGTIVASLYATCPLALAYSGEIWPQSVLPPFVLLFLFCLFRGVVERRRGWFLPASLLLGILCQIHGSAFLLTALLAASCILAFRTIRWHEILLAIGLLGLLCSPYLFWEWHNHFFDAKLLLNVLRTPAHVNLDAWGFYKSFLSPYVASPYVQSATSRSDLLPTDPHAVLVDSPLHYLRRPLRWEYALMPWLLVGGVLVTALQAFWPQLAQRSTRNIGGTTHKRGSIRSWLSDFWATPYRQGLLLLLIWQVLLPMSLIRHAFPLYSHYFIIFLPGQFILIGLFICKVIDVVPFYRPQWKGAVQHFARGPHGRNELPSLSMTMNCVSPSVQNSDVRPQWNTLARCGMIALVAGIVGAQLVGSMSQLIDRINGNFDGQAFFPAYNDLASLQHVLQEADQVAQEQHIHRIYLATTYSTGSAMRYLMEQEKTPITAFDDWHCVVLPSASAGPVIFIGQSSDLQVGAIINHYATTKLVDQPRHLAGPPFNLFILTAKPATAPATQAFTHDIQLVDRHTPEAAPATQTFTHDIQLVDQHAVEVQDKTRHIRWLVTHWSIIQSAKPITRTFYMTQFDIRPNGKVQPGSTPIDCSTTSSWAGDQYFTLQSLGPHDQMPQFVTVRVYTFTNSAVTFRVGPLTLSTFAQGNSREIPLRTGEP